MTADNVVNHAESNTTVTITGTVGGDVGIGDTVTVTVGEHTFSATVAEGDTWSVEVDGSILANNSSITASITAGRYGRQYDHCQRDAYVQRGYNG